MTLLSWAVSVVSYSDKASTPKATDDALRASLALAVSWQFRVSVKKLLKCHFGLLTATAYLLFISPSTQVWGSFVLQKPENDSFQNGILDLQFATGGVSSCCERVLPVLMTYAHICMCIDMEHYTACTCIYMLRDIDSDNLWVPRLSSLDTYVATCVQIEQIYIHVLINSKERNM